MFQNNPDRLKMNPRTRGPVAFARPGVRRSPASPMDLMGALEAHRSKNFPDMTDAEFRKMAARFFRYALSRKPAMVRRYTVLECETCGHVERWELGSYDGERRDFDHHDCNRPGSYVECGPDCSHQFPGRVIGSGTAA